MDFPQEVGNRDGEPKIREWLGNLPVADAERPVSRHPGDHALTRMHDAEVVETGDVQAVADELDEVADRVRLAAGHDE